MAKKFYVVFDGKTPGIYNTWAECQAQTKGVKGAKFKSFETLDEAEREYESHQNQGELTPEEIAASISTDGSCLGSPGKMEYRVVHTDSGGVIFNSDVFPLGTNNIAEFLALVKAMKYLDKEGQKEKIIFTDSITAISWVRNKRVNTNLDRTEDTEKLYEEINEAQRWLEGQDMKDYRILKWETHLYGEIKADFGRK